MRILIAVPFALLLSTTALAAPPKIFTTPGWYVVDFQLHFKGTVSGPYRDEAACRSEGLAKMDEDAAAEIGIFFDCEYLPEAMTTDT